MPVGGTFITERSATERFVRLLDKAKKLGLFASPAYTTARERSCWEAGYEYALRDLAAGKLSD